MNGMNMGNFLLGFAVANKLEQKRDQFGVALSASFFPNLYGPILMKPQVDAWSARESEVASLKSQVSALQSQVTCAPELFKLAETATLQQGATEQFDLKVPGVSVTPESGAVSANVDTTTGKVVLTGRTLETDVDIAIDAAGLKRTIKRTVVSAAERAAGSRGSARSE